MRRRVLVVGPLLVQAFLLHLALPGHPALAGPVVPDPAGRPAAGALAARPAPALPPPALHAIPAVTSDATVGTELAAGTELAGPDRVPDGSRGHESDVERSGRAALVPGPAPDLRALGAGPTTGTPVGPGRGARLVTGCAATVHGAFSRAGRSAPGGERRGEPVPPDRAARRGVPVGWEKAADGRPLTAQPGPDLAGCRVLRC
ncbi:hypothetical protein [Micromonospora fluostatini]|uniref:hypothetical protein n=1 Tax=Micromonospora sp. JCM 30529 TaxID=3421643 RepID=UPI003D172D14